jgi:hypothetical protein
MTCLTEPETLLLALDDRAGVTDAATRHAGTCEACGARVAGLQRVVHEFAAASVPARASDGSCLDEIALAELADGGGTPDDRRVRVVHLVSCGYCRRQLASLVELLTDHGVAAEIQATERSAPRRTARTWRFAGAGVIAAVLAVAVLVPRFREPDATVHRAPTITAAAAPALTSPVGDVANVSALRWAPVAGADLYRVTLYDAASRVLYETQVAATSVTLPDSVVVAPGRSYLWKVEARTGFERWTSSDLADFTVRNRP